MPGFDEKCLNNPSNGNAHTAASRMIIPGSSIVKTVNPSPIAPPIIKPSTGHPINLPVSSSNAIALRPLGNLYTWIVFSKTHGVLETRRKEDRLSLGGGGIKGLFDFSERGEDVVFEGLHFGVAFILEKYHRKVNLVLQ